jgi:hypothetical protein
MRARFASGSATVASYTTTGDTASWSSEDEVIRRVAAETADIPITVDVKNQARVHLWYAERFGGDYPQLKSSQDGIDRYLVSCTCVGIEVQSGKVYTPDGLHDLARGVLRMNLRNPRPNLFRQKAEDYRSRWPWLTIMQNHPPRAPL